MDGMLHKSGIITKQSKYRSLETIKSGKILFAATLLLFIAVVLPEIVRVYLKQ